MCESMHGGVRGRGSNPPTYSILIKNLKIMYMKYECSDCGYVYDESKEKVKFIELPDDWECPECGSPKSDFELIE